MYNVTLCLTQLYLLLSGTPVDPLTMDAAPPAWCKPVFHLVLVTFTALVILTRVARHSSFWVLCGAFNIFVFVFCFVLLVLCGIKTRGLALDVGFPTRSTWTRSFSYMVFTGLPLKVAAVDGPAQ